MLQEWVVRNPKWSGEQVHLIYRFPSLGTRLPRPNSLPLVNRVFPSETGQCIRRHRSKVIRALFAFFAETSVKLICLFGNSSCDWTLSSNTGQSAERLFCCLLQAHHQFLLVLLNLPCLCEWYTVCKEGLKEDHSFRITYKTVPEDGSTAICDLVFCRTLEKVEEEHHFPLSTKQANSGMWHIAELCKENSFKEEFDSRLGCLFIGRSFMNHERL